MDKNMSKLYTWALISFLVINACSDANLEKEINDQQDDLIINAKVENASKYSNVVEVKLMMYGIGELARGEWKDGGFTIEFPKIIDPKGLHGFFSDGSRTTVIISNENVQLSNVYFIGYDKDGKAVANFTYFDASSWDDMEDMLKIDYTEVMYTYVSTDVTVSGYLYEIAYTITNGDPDAPGEIERTKNYSLNWEQGWNVWFLSYSETIIGDSYIWTELWTSDSDCELKWYGNEKNLHSFL